MVSITQNKKDGKVNSYKFKACVGRDEFGKQIFRCTTWKVPDGLMPSRMEKAAQKAAAEWEKQVKDEYKRDLQNPERIKLDIQKFLIYLRTEYRTKQNKPVSDKTVRHSYCVLVMIFEFAEEQELIQKNPMNKVDCPKLAKKKVDAFSADEAKTFLSLLPGCDRDFRCMMYLLLTAGLRRGELMGLQWRDFDFQNMTFDICRNITYSPDKGNVVDTPKTENSIRTIPLLPFVAEQLKTYRTADCPESGENAFVFPSSRGSDIPRTPNALTHRVKRFMKSNGLPDMSPPQPSPQLCYTVIEQWRRYKECLGSLRTHGCKHDTKFLCTVRPPANENRHR